MKTLKLMLLFLIIPFILVFATEQAKAQWTYDEVSFEMPVTKIVIDPAGGNIWQIGTPQKTFFSSAHGGVMAILTDTIHNYPPNDTSYFIYIIRDPYTKTCYTQMDFWHKYDMDSPGDKGIIDASYDGGKSWVQVKDTSVNFWGSHFYWNQDYHAADESYSDHNLITNGKSDSWIKSGFSWQWYMPVKKDTIVLMPDSLMIRFTFISDSVVKSREGWMIDDIVTSSAGWELCSGIDENTGYGNISVSPNPFSTQTSLQTNELLKQATLTIYNSFGQAVKQMKNISGRRVILYRDNLPDGMYYLRLTEGNKTVAAEKLFIRE